MFLVKFFFFFFQAEDGIRDYKVTGVQTCALPILLDRVGEVRELAVERHRDRALGERGRDALGDVETGAAAGIVPTCAVGKGQSDHHALLLLTRCLRMQVSVGRLTSSASWGLQRQRSGLDGSFSDLEVPSAEIFPSGCLQKAAKPC